GDRPELLGPITLNGIPAGAQLLDADGKLLHTATGDPITIVLSNPDAGNEHIAGASGTLHLTKGQFESLKINPAAHDGDNITVTVSVDSYEVDNAGNPLPGIPSANTTVDVTVDVQAVTDTVTLAFKDGVSGTFTMDEDTRFDLTAQLEAAFQDLDGSEQRDIVIGGLPSGSSVFVNGNAITVGSDGSFTVQATGQTGNIGSVPKIEIRPPAHFSGNMNDITDTL